MKTEITKSKISQDLRNAAREIWRINKTDVLLNGADAIDELNQRLMDQTSAGMERGKKDQEEIKRLNQKLGVSKETIERLLDYVNQPPDSNCACHLVAPCADCTEYADIRDLLESANSLINPQKEGA